MKPDRVIAKMIRASEIPAEDVSRRLGHFKTWAQVTMQPGRDPKLSTVAAVADVTGHKLAVLDAETDRVVVTIDPPERSPKPKAQGEDA